MANLNDTAKNENKQSISLIIAERTYHFKVSNEDEEKKLRDAAKLINKRVSYYFKAYSANNNLQNDMQDTLSIIALQFVVKLIDEENRNNLEPIQNELNDLNNKLENYLKSTQ